MNCPYCGSDINENLENCLHCGKTNENYIPKTIEELKRWYVNRNLPDENITRFFIGKNYTQPKAFGIYKEDSSSNFCVYKNKADGSRAVRYEGPDEAFAVKELYLRLKDEIYNQKAQNVNPISSSYTNNVSNSALKSVSINKFTIFIILLIFIIPIMSLIISAKKPKRGYYRYNNNYYYYQSGDWYEYDTRWHPVSVPKSLSDDYNNYYYSSYYTNIYGVGRFEDSSYYRSPSEDSSSSSYSSDWDSDSSWDSSSTDWDSDW